MDYNKKLTQIENQMDRIEQQLKTLYSKPRNDKILDSVDHLFHRLRSLADEKQKIKLRMKFEEFFKDK